MPTLGTEVRAGTSKMENCMEPAPVLASEETAGRIGWVRAKCLLAEVLLVQVTRAMHWGGNA